MRLVRALPPAVLLLLLLAPPAAAQPADPSIEGKYHLGESISFSPALVMVAATDSNLIRSDVGEAGQEFYAVPQVEAWVGRGYTRLNLVGAFEYGRTSLDGGTATVNNFVQARGDAGSRRASIYGLVGRRDHFAPPSDFSGFELSLRSRRVEGTLEGGAQVAPIGRLRLNTVVRRASLRYDADARYQGLSLERNLNRDSTSFEGGIDYELTALSSLSVSATRNQERFLFAPERDGNGYNVLAGARFQPRALIGGRFLVGYLKYETLQTRANYGGPSYNIGLTLTKAQVLLDVSGSRLIDFSFDPSNGFYVSSGVDAFMLVRVGRAFDLFGSGAMRQLQPRGAISEFEPFRGIQFVRLGVARRFGPTTQIGVEGETYETGGPGGFSAKRVLAFLTFGSTRLQRLDRPRPGSF